MFVHTCWPYHVKSKQQLKDGCHDNNVRDESLWRKLRQLVEQPLGTQVSLFRMPFQLYQKQTKQNENPSVLNDNVIITLTYPQYMHKSQNNNANFSMNNVITMNSLRHFLQITLLLNSHLEQPLCECLRHQLDKKSG